MRGKTMLSSVPALALWISALLGLAESDGTCLGSQGECQGTALLQHGFAAGRKGATNAMVVEHDHPTSEIEKKAVAAKTAIPRNDLTNIRAPLHTNLATPGYNIANQHNRCTGSSPDGRLFLCGTAGKFLRYFKFESMQFTSDGVPIFNDDVWAGGNESQIQGFLEDASSVSWCWPNRSHPFEQVIESDGRVVHVYSTIVFDTVDMKRLTVRVANPYAANAQIINWTTGLAQPVNQEMPHFHAISGDGKLIVGSDGDEVSFIALPETEEPCSVCSEAWSAKRPIHEMHSDPDGLNLRNRYGLAKYPLTDAMGEAFKDSYVFTGKYSFLDLEARNLFIGEFGGVRLIGADTLGVETMPDGAINQDALGSIRYWTSFWSNFESLRTKAQRFEGEDHTSGVGSTTGFQLPMTSDPGALTMMSGWRQYYTELNLRGYKEAANDIVHLPMSMMWVTKPDESYMHKYVDLSRNRFNVESSTAPLQRNRTTDVPTAVQGFGSAARMSKGTLRVPLGDSKASTVGLTSPSSALSVVVSFYPNNRLGNCSRPIISHANLSLAGRWQKMEWNLNGLKLAGGDFAAKAWVHAALVFDGVSGVVSVYRNGVLHSRSSTDMTDFQFLASDPDMILGNEVFGRRNSCSFEGFVSFLRITPRALTGVEICDYAHGSDCAGSINFQATNTQLQLSQQDPDCNAASLNTLACAHAMHRVCYNFVAMKESIDNNVSSAELTNFGSATIPVSMGGMPISMTGSKVALACTPFAGAHLSVPVEFFHMQQYEPQCLPVTDGTSEMLYCNLAAKAFCQAAMAEHEPSSNAEAVTGLVYEVDSRAWVTCFEADSVMTPTKASLAGCTDGGLASAACMLSASAACNAGANTTAGVIQAVGADTLTVHCFSAPAGVGVMDVNF